MARREVTGRKPGVGRFALSIPEFCESFGISEAFYFKLKRQGLGPVEMKVGQRILISLEATAAWRAQREAAAADATEGAA
jgi:hypothetical protein